ncbi:MAG TPA: serine hydrolase [Rudaea sp.]|nr:serine hydrolase [Rudaea sp.]
MTRLIAVLLGICWLGPAVADRLYSDGFQIPVLEPLFPTVGQTHQLPSGPTTDQLAWVLSELASGQNTTKAEVSAHFVASYDAQTMSDFFNNTLRTSFPNAIIRDVVSVTPVRVTVVISTPGGATPYGYLNIGASYTGTKKIVLLGVNNYYGSVQYPADQNLTLTQAADKFETLSGSPALLIGRIGSNFQCTAVVDRNADQLRATGSIFKLWVLGGVARAVAQGTVDINTTIALVASQLALGGTINSEPLGTLLPLQDMAKLMIGISDNTATDHLHHLVGRDLIGDVIVDFGVSQPDVLRPLLNISEQFSLYFSFPLATANTYINGSEAFQLQFLHDSIEPLGPVMGGAYANTQVFLTGTWRATPLDICRTFAHLRRLPQGSDAMDLVNQALGAGVAQPEVRGKWDRVWYKGGSLDSGAGHHVLTHAWMLENTGQSPWVVIAMANNAAGGIDEYQVQSVTGRMLELVSTMP